MEAHMIREAIGHLVAGQSLSETDAAAAMEEIMTGTATPAQLGAFLTALRLKGETVEVVTGLARVMREKSVNVSVPLTLQAVDTCGPGGDGAGTFNVSTAAGLVVAAAGQPVAKHGNRAASSRCGSADVLEALGVKLELHADQVAECVTEVGFGFMFAPVYHPAMRHVGPVRREIGIRTIFNILGPLTNPAGARYQVLCVADARHLRLMGEALLRLGCARALVIHGEDGVDEFSVSAPTRICEVRGDAGTLTEYGVTPEEVGLPRRPPPAGQGGDAAANATLLRAVFVGDQTGAPAEMVALNAGAALFTTGQADSLQDGLRQAQDAIRSGRVVSLLEALAARTHAYAGAAE